MIKISVTICDVYHKVTHDVFLISVPLFEHLFEIDKNFDTFNPIHTTCHPMVWSIRATQI